MGTRERKAARTPRRGVHLIHFRTDSTPPLLAWIGGGVVYSAGSPWSPWWRANAAREAPIAAKAGAR